MKQIYTEEFCKSAVATLNSSKVEGKFYSTKEISHLVSKIGMTVNTINVSILKKMLKYSYTQDKVKFYSYPDKPLYWGKLYNLIRERCKQVQKPTELSKAIELLKRNGYRVYKATWKEI